MKNNRALFIVLSFCTINVFGMETKTQKSRQNKNYNINHRKNNNSNRNKYSNKHTYKAVVQLPGTSSVAASTESFKVVVKSSGNSLVTVSKYTHKVVVTSPNMPSVIVPQESFKQAPQSCVFVPRSLSVTPEKTTFGSPQTTKMLLAHSNALFKSNGHSLAAHEDNLRHSVNEKILVNHLFQTLAMFNNKK